MSLSSITHANSSILPNSSIPTSSSPPASFATQPTQILPPNSPNKPPPSIVQVEASSPVGSPAQHRPTVSRSIAQHDRSVRPFDFYNSKAAGNIITLDSDGPQYIGSSSEGDGSDHDIKPTFGSLTFQGQNVDRIAESPVSTNKSQFAQFAYNGGRLDSLKAPAFGTAAATGFRPQRRPEPATPVITSPLEVPAWLREKVDRMKAVLPNRPTHVLMSALFKKAYNWDDAMEYLISMDDHTIVDLTTSRDDIQRAAAVKTLNRATGAGRVAIKDKWGSTQAQVSPVRSSPPPQQPRARRLVRGSERSSNAPTPPPQKPIILDDSDSAAEIEDDDSEDERELEKRVLNYINSCTAKELSDIACTTEDIAEVVLAQRPFKSLDYVREVREAPVNKTKKRGGKTRAIGEKLVDICLETWRGYEAVDSLIEKVEKLGRPIAESIKTWGVDIVSGTGSGELDMTDINIESDAGSAKDSGIGTPTEGSDPIPIDEADAEIKGSKRAKPMGFFKEQPKNMKEGVVLKDYQIAGVNWLNLLYEKRLSCILADEMGLGKTCQVVAFLAHLLTKGIKGPHLVVVPSSTLENWLREFANFCPELKVEPYYGSQKERPHIRAALQKDRTWNVLVTTYQLATGDKNDRGFLKNVKFNCCVYDEGHMLKNSASNRYDALIKLPADYRLLLTGTPLQNNLQELASLLAFILPSVFEEKKDDLQSIFKYKAKTTDDDESNSALLSQQRIKRARAMMTPFVLRRKKQQVLKHLPAKTQRVEYCEMNKLQNQIYIDNITSAQEAITARANGKKPSKSATNVMMQLRKAAIHPLLFRTNYPDDKLRKMSKDIMKEEAYRNNDAQIIFEDMEVMNDLELSRLCNNFPRTLGKYALKKEEWMNAGKVVALKDLLLDMKKNGDRVLIFSQFTQMMDILELVLTTLGLGFLRIDGSTPVDQRQDLIDQYHEELDIMVFLLSTKSGGFGINLACANKVVIFDSSFNPHDDAQASDRAHRVGQTRNVEVIRLVTKGTIEEQILALANTKLALDQSISEGDDKAFDGRAEELVAKMLLQAKSNEKVEGV
ncbi:SNF2 family N-terminal domain-containing protein [Geopyxis carbonaria]|nr:SNF2 family N-terminal domain-containing protein [Geopyxis carbonaria]